MSDTDVLVCEVETGDIGIAALPQSDPSSCPAIRQRDVKLRGLSDYQNENIGPSRHAVLVFATDSVRRTTVALRSMISAVSSSICFSSLSKRLEVKHFLRVNLKPRRQFLGR